METAAYVSSKKRLQISINLILMCIVTGIMMLALTTALPELMREMQIQTTTAQWLTSSYNLVMGITMLCTGFLITRFPVRRLYPACTAVFMIGLVICGAAAGFVPMLIGRLLQAFG